MNSTSAYTHPVEVSEIGLERSDSSIHSLKHPAGGKPKVKSRTSLSARATTRRPAGARNEAGLAVGARMANNILMIQVPRVFKEDERSSGQTFKELVTRALRSCLEYI